MSGYYFGILGARLSIAFGVVDRLEKSSFGKRMMRSDPMMSANIRRLANASAHNDRLWEAIKWIAIEIRQQAPSKGKGTAANPFPSTPTIVSWLNEYGFVTTRKRPINYNTVSGILKDRFDEWSAIPTIEEIENALPAPEPSFLHRFRLTEDIGEFEVGDYGMILEVVEGGVRAAFTDWNIVGSRDPKADILAREPMENPIVLVKYHQMRMVAHNLHEWMGHPPTLTELASSLFK